MDHTSLLTTARDELYGNTLLTDAVMNARIPMVEARVNRVLRVQDMTNIASATIGDTSGQDNADATALFVLPSDYRGVVSFEITVSGQDEPAALKYCDPQEYLEKVADDDTRAQPTHFTVLDGQFKVYPVPDAEYPVILTYFQKVPALSASATTNWLIEEHPDVYLYGLCALLAAFLKEDADQQRYEGLFSSAMGEIVADDERMKALARKTGRFATLGSDQGLFAASRYDITTDT